MSLLFSVSGTLLGSLVLGADSSAASSSGLADGAIPRSLGVAALAGASHFPPLIPLAELSDVAGFMRIAGSSGPTPNPTKTGAFDVTAFGFAASEPNRESLQPCALGVTIPATEASSALYHYCATGRAIATIEFEFVSHEDSAPFLIVELSNVILHAVDTGNFSAAIGRASTLALRFSFERVQFEAPSGSSDASAERRPLAFWDNAERRGSPGFADSAGRWLSVLERTAKVARAPRASYRTWSD